MSCPIQQVRHCDHAAPSWQPGPECKAEQGKEVGKTSQHIRATSEMLRLGSSMQAQEQSSCQHSRCWQADRRLHLVCLRTFFFPEELAGSSIHGNSPRAASGSNGIFLPSQSRGVGFCFILLVWETREGKHADEGHQARRDLYHIYIYKLLRFHTRIKLTHQG